jgi:two-component system sensor histidine kinase HydH
LENQKNLVIVGTAASTLAHEIKNPLLAIRLQTSILKKLLPEDSDGREEIQAIDEEVERLSSMTYRVNDFLRDAAGNRSNIDAVSILEETFQRLTGRAAWTAADRPDQAVVLMDEARLRSVLENIIRNALESESPAEEVRASVRKSASEVAIYIVDRGKGISEENFKQVFDPFYTSKSSGTGIGLAVSKRFIEAAGGGISLANREGGGVEAEISLPLAKGK